MINILPDEGRLVARRAYLFRLATVTIFAGAAISLSAGALLFPSYIETKSAATAAKEEAARLAAGAQQGEQDTSSALKLAQEELVAFKATATQVAPSVRIEKVLRERGSGIKITQIQSNQQGAQVILAGVASTRETLLAFVQRLRKVSGVVSADLPVSDLAKGENARFTVTISFAPPAIPTAPATPSTDE